MGTSTCFYNKLSQRNYDNKLITFYLYKPTSKPFQRTQSPQGQGFSRPVQQSQNMVQENDDMDDQLPSESEEQAPF